MDVFSTEDEELSYIVRILVDLKFKSHYDRPRYLAKSARQMQMLKSHHYIELVANQLVQGTVAYVVDGRRFTFSPRALLSG